MKNSIIIHFYKNLTRKELEQFTDFIESPFFNKNEDVKSLHYYLHALYPVFNEKQLINEDIFRQIFDAKNYSYRKLKYVFDLFTSLIEQFFMVLGTRNNNVMKHLFLLEYVLENNDSLFIHNLNKIKRRVNHKNYNYAQMTYIKYKMFELEYNYYLMKADRKRSMPALKTSVENLDKFFSSERLQASYAMMNKEKIRNEKFSYDLIERLLPYIGKSQDKYLEYLYNLYFLKKHVNDEEYYEKTKLSLETAQMPLSDLQEGYSILKNYCIEKIKQGNTTYLLELHKIHINTIKNKVIFDNNQISEWTYKNIVTVGLRLKEYAWTEEFANNYKEYLPKKSAENAYTYNMANINYAQGRFDEAQSFLLNVKFKDVVYATDSAFLLLKIYYETDSLENLEQQLDTFRLMVQRNRKMSTLDKQAYLSLIRFTRHLVKLKQVQTVLGTDDFVRKLEKLEKEINTTKQIMNKTWLKEKLDELTPSLKPTK